MLASGLLIKMGNDASRDVLNISEEVLKHLPKSLQVFSEILKKADLEEEKNKPK